MTLQVTQRCDLEIHRALALARPGHLEHVTLAIRRRHTMILVSLTLERRELTGQVPMRTGELDELIEREPGGIEVQVHGAERPLFGDIHSVRLPRVSIVGYPRTAVSCWPAEMRLTVGIVSASAAVLSSR